MSKVVFIVGSLREGSFTKQYAEVAEKALEGKAEVSYLDWSAIPVFSQDLESDLPTAVKAAQEAVLEADAIWIFSPVYNASIPGSIKNTLDWLSRALDLSDTTSASALQDKISTVTVAAFAHQDVTVEQYRTLLGFIRTQFVENVATPTITLSETFQLIIDEATQEAITAQAESVLKAIAKATA